MGALVVLVAEREGRRNLGEGSGLSPSLDAMRSLL